MFEFSIPAKARVPVPHFHKAVDEVIYALEGTTPTTLDGVRHELRAGQCLFIPRGSVHTHENLHSETARSLIVITPGTIGRRYFNEIAHEVNVTRNPDLVKIKEIMIRHGLVPTLSKPLVIGR
ncbi:MAG: cupin domain-containing protein [Bosea sp.]|uniref:cupin domain-containing protein n=1 Tax=Bosea sp. (in: a-proteobacteria) TaxID=1871050 RepID=UPI001AC42F34|nr:cupin domain-containing protein [Bosea sp. (in: a-proteobacteria)]MBN9471064.1 cupin domain-containing protein [Bosea sp. (in: a-proteobacteria)]